MPYRRLPNTDNARVRALEKALLIGKELPPFKLAFSQKSFQEIQSFVPGFKQSIELNKQNYERYLERTREYQKELKKIKLYLTHFVQVVNMAIQRGELHESTREFYGLAKDEKNLPSLNSETDLINWGEKIIEGETRRCQRGMSPVTNPTVAMVKVWYEKFIDIYRFQKTMLEKHSRSQDILTEQRKRADRIILSVWNEVEDYFGDLPDDMKREKAMEYGLAYVYRKNELQRIGPFLFEKRNIG